MWKELQLDFNTVNILRMTTGFHTFVNTSSPPSVSPVHTLEMALQLLTTSLSCLINRRIFFPLSAVFEAHSLSSGSVCNEDMAVGMMTFMPTWRIESWWGVQIQVWYEDTEQHILLTSQRNHHFCISTSHSLCQNFRYLLHLKRLGRSQIHCEEASDPIRMAELFG